MSNSAFDSGRKEESCRQIVSFIEGILPPDHTHPSRGKLDFLRRLPGDSRILDLGCGNNSPKITKEILPNCYYVGIDVGNYNQNSDIPADEYLIVSPDKFNGSISIYNNSMDAAISSHNVEHCLDGYGAIDALAKSLKIGGKAYISFPSFDSKNFPSRTGTLNYYDDLGHNSEPPDFGKVISALSANGLRIDYATTRHQPPLSWVMGLGTENSSVESGNLKDGTWAYWGFETVIWAERVA